MQLENIINEAWEQRASVDASHDDVVQPVDQAIALLDRGEARVAEPGKAGWTVHEWLKKAVLLSFRLPLDGRWPRHGERVCSGARNR